MKSIVGFSFFLLLAIVFFISCQKELSCYDCERNKFPIAIAGEDQTTILPGDSVLLDGSASSDPDGTITSYHWSKISGPLSSNIQKTDSSKTLVKALVAGVYQFELTVKDNGGLSANDTVQIFVDAILTINHPPVANAGADQTITLPTNKVNLDGSGSTDPDNNITSYAWTKIEGPSSFTIANGSSVKTQVTNLAEGVYFFELNVMDAGGLFSKDTVQVTVYSAIINVACDISNRPLVNAQLTPYVSIPNIIHPNNNEYKIVAVGNKLIFRSQTFWNGGYNPIYIYDIVSQSWSTAELSIPRAFPGIATVGNKVYFAGGTYNDGSNIDTMYSTIDIYEASTNTWSVSSLSMAGNCQDGVTLGDNIFFPCGGFVQMFNTTAGTCTTKKLSVPRWGLSAIAVSDKVYFAGGGETNPISAGGVSAIVDVFDNNTNNWSQFSLAEPKESMAGIFADNTIFWAGGRKAYLPTDTLSSLVQAYNINTKSSATACLFQPKSGFKAVVKGNKIIFFTGNHSQPENKFDIYDIATKTWSIGVLPVYIQFEDIISHNNTIYVAGGVVNGNWTPQVWTLEF
ncbi:MAG: PKD domain-containing protein [Ginsengibacter sp.]